MWPHRRQPTRRLQSLGSLITRGMQIKTTMRYHFTLTKVTVIRKEGKEEGNVSPDKSMAKLAGPWCTAGENVQWCSCCGKRRGVSQKKLNKESPDNSAILPVGIYPQRTGSMDSDRYLHTHIHSCIIHKKPSPSGLHKPNPSNSVKSFKVGADVQK